MTALGYFFEYIAKGLTIFFSEYIPFSSLKISFLFNAFFKSLATEINNCLIDIYYEDKKFRIRYP